MSRALGRARINGEWIEDIDEEIIDLVELLNYFKSTHLYTIESCWGHKKEPCRIWFKSDDIRMLNTFMHYFFNGEDPDWKLLIETADPVLNGKELLFRLESKQVLKDTSAIIRLEERIKNKINNAIKERK
jgi:hypothetical protein